MAVKSRVWPAVEARNVEAVGYHDLQKRPAFKLALQVVNDRWYLYLSHFWHSGWTVLDVTDPSSPEFLRFVPGPDNTFTLQVQVADGLMIGSLEKIFLPGWGGDDTKPFEEGILIYDVATDPTDPKLLAHWKTGSQGTHRNFYGGGRYLHLAAATPGFSGYIYRILDIADPRQPQEVGRWGFPEQWKAAGAKPTTPNTNLHSPYVEGDRAYLSYSAGGYVSLDISDITSPQLISHIPFYPLGGNFAVHTAVPLPRRNLVVLNSESVTPSCTGQMNYVGILDIAEEAKPRIVSFFPPPVPSPEMPYRTYCDKPDRFGPHNQHHPQGSPALESRDDRIYLTYFNAGLRIFDISDPRQAQEIAYYVPADPTERLGPQPLRLAVSTEDVLVDTRGFIYLTDKNLGVQILRCTA